MREKSLKGALGPRLPLLLAFALLLPGAAAACAAQKRSRPQDRGGVSLLLAVKAAGPQLERSVAGTVAVIERRCARLGVYCNLQRREGDDGARLALRFSTTKDAGRVKRILLAEGMELRAVVSPPFPAPMPEYSTHAEAVAAAGVERDVFPFPDGDAVTHLVTERAAILTGDDLRSCAALASDESFGEYEVDCQLRPEGAARLKAWTGANINRYVALVFNRRALSAAYIVAQIEYNVVVSGGFDRRQAKDVAVILESGNLPAPLELLEEGTYKP